MERKTAVTTAGAITMSVVSVLFAIGASSGALGSSASSSPAPVSASAPVSAAPATQAAGSQTVQTATSRTVSERQSDDQGRQSPSGAGARSESDD